MKNIFFPAEIIDSVRSSEDERRIKLLENTIKKADSALELELFNEESVQVNGEGFAIQHENYGKAAGPFSAYMPYLAFAYEYTGDEKYLIKAKEMMLRYCSFSRWHGKGAIGKGELTTGAFLIGMSYGWAAFSEKFTEAEKEFIADRIYTLGIRAQLDDWLLPGTKIHCFDTMGHNWWPVCVSTGALAAITMSDYLPDGRGLADKASAGLREWFNYKGNPLNMKPATLDNGAFYESVNYLNYALREYLTFSEAYLQVTGKPPFDDKKILTQAAGFFVNTCYPSGCDNFIVGFGDTDNALFATSVMQMLSRYPDLGILRFYINRRNLENEDSLQKLIRFNELYLMPEKEPEKLNVCYENIGWAIFRDSFDIDSTLLAVKCGDSWNHAHCDAGHFIFMKNGRNEIFDSSCCSYGNDIYRDYYVQSKAHNVVLFNGNGQCPDDHHHHVRPKGQLYNYTDNGNYRYICADASGPMGRYFRKHLRHFIWADDIIIIYDDIWAYEAGEANFLLHAEEENSFVMLTDCEKRTENGYLGNDVREVTFTSYNRKTDDYGRVKFISAICTDTSEAPVFTEIEDGYKITYKGKSIYINILSDNRVMHRNCFNTFDGILTDATVLIESNNEFFVVNASIVRKDGVSLLDNLARITGKI